MSLVLGCLCFAVVVTVGGLQGRQLCYYWGREEVGNAFFICIQRINLHWSFHGYLFTPLVQGIGVWLPGLVHCSFAAVACASRVLESVGVFLYRCQFRLSRN